MPRKPIGDVAMTGAERQRQWRERLRKQNPVLTDRQKLAQALAEMERMRKQQAAAPRQEPAKTAPAAKAKAEPGIARADLSMSAQQRLDAAIRQHQRQLDLRFKLKVDEEVRKRIDEIVLPHWKQQIAEAEAIMNQRKGILKSKDEFKAILSCLHPDSRHSTSDKKLARAFDLFNGLEKFLLNEKESPTAGVDVPSSLAEWDRMRKKKR